MFFEDTFTGTTGAAIRLHTPDTGSGWTLINGTDWRIDNNRAAPAGNFDRIKIDDAPDSADYDVQADYIQIGTTVTTNPGILARFTDADNHLIVKSTATGVKLQQVDGGVFTDKGSWTGASWANGVSHTIKLELRGTTAKVYVGGVEEISATVSITAQGAIGMAAGDTATYAVDGIKLDNFSVSNPPAGAVPLAGTSAASSGASASLTVDAGAPAAPTGVTVSGPTATTLEVEWADQTGGEWGHRVYFRETGSGDPWLLYSQLPAGTTSETVEDLEEGTGHDVGVASWNGSEESDIIFDAGTTTGDTPTTPGDLEVVSFTASTVTLSWTPTSNFDHNVYYRTPAGSGGWTLYSTIGFEFESETVTGLSANTEYEFAVTADDGATETLQADAAVTQTTAEARYVAGVYFIGTEGRTVVEAEDGAIPEETGVSDGAGTKTLPKGVRYGSVAHLGSVEFGDTYEDAPLVVYTGGGLSMEQRAKWGTKAQVDAGTASSAAPSSNGVYQEPLFETDAAGFTAYLYLRNSATLDNESTSLGVPTTLTALGVTGSATPPSGDLPAYNSTYTVTYSGSIQTNKSGSASASVALEARLNGGSWTEIRSSAHTHSFPLGGGFWDFEGSLAGVISGFDGSGLDQFRCRLKALSVAGSNPTVQVAFGPAVTWQSSAASYASMTPEPGDAVRYLVVGNVTGLG
jgi:hypothetical protein